MSDPEEILRRTLADAEPVSVPRTPEPEGDGSGHNGGPGGDYDWREGMPPGCRVRPVGKHGTVSIFLDASSQLAFAGPRDLGEAHLTMFFDGDIDHLSYWFPYFNKDREWVRGKFVPEDVRRAIQKHCSEAGLWENMERVRGRGAWRGENGALHLHCGDVIVSEDGTSEPDVLGEHVYPAGAPILRPAKAAADLPSFDDRQSAAWRIYELVKSWNWSRGAFDARLYFGSIITGFLGGALPWRPSSWTIGDAATGKSTLQRLRRQVMGGWSLNTADTTAAGLYSTLKFDALSVSYDEAENESGGFKLDSVVKLARLSASGDVMLRGSSSQVPVSFSARNVFAFSSIRPAPLRQQDAMRIPELQLYPLTPNAPEPAFTIPDCRKWGGELLRRIMENWPRFDRTFQEHREELRRLGHDSRGQDTFGTLLACADLVLSECGFLSEGKVDDDPDAAEIWDRARVQNLAEYADRMPDWQSCLDTLLSARPRDWRNQGDVSVGGVLADFLRDWGENSSPDIGGTNNKLALAGLTLIPRPGGEGVWWLGISNRSPGLMAIFDGTDWQSVPNATGIWIKSLKGGPEELIRRGHWPDGSDIRFTVGGKQSRGVAVRLDKVIDTALVKLPMKEGV